MVVPEEERSATMPRPSVGAPRQGVVPTPHVKTPLTRSKLKWLSVDIELE